MIKVDFDNERATLPLSLREKIVLRLILFAVALIYPATYDHQLKEWLQGIDK